MIKTYRGYYIFKLPDKEYCGKIIEMLEEKLKAKSICLEEQNYNLFYLSFLVDSSRKVFPLESVIESYGGEVKKRWIG
jgi:hypothetical protein